MARKRMIDPIIWEDEKFGKLSPRARILFIGLFSNADDEGRIRANDSYVRSTIFMYDDISLSDVRQLVDEVATTLKSSITLYEVGENRYIELSHWTNYQTQREDRIRKSLLPGPNNKNVSQMTDKCQSDDGHLTAEVKLSKVKLREREEKTTSSLNYLKKIPQEDLDEFHQKFIASKSQVESKAIQLANYCEGHGKKYKNYKAMLNNALIKDFGFRPEIKQGPPPEPELSPEEKEKAMKKLAEIRSKFHPENHSMAKI